MMAFSPLALVAFLVPLAYSPGPGNMFFAANGAALGFRSTIPANIGYHAATWVVTMAIGIGLDSGLDRYPSAFTTLEVVGAAYVMWIAWKLFRSNAIDTSGDSTRSTATDGALLLVLNPKAYVIIALMFTQFLDGTAEHRLVTVVLITTIFTVNNMISFTIWAAIGDRLVRTFRSERSARRINIGLSATLAAVSVWIAAG